VALALLLPRYGVFGAAAASLLAYTSSHLYLLRQVRPILGGGPKNLFLLNGGDVKALLGALHHTRLRLTGSAQAPGARIQETLR